MFHVDKTARERSFDVDGPETRCLPSRSDIFAVDRIFPSSGEGDDKVLFVEREPVALKDDIAEVTAVAVLQGAEDGNIKRLEDVGAVWRQKKKVDVVGVALPHKFITFVTPMPINDQQPLPWCCCPGDVNLLQPVKRNVVVCLPFWACREPPTGDSIVET